VTVPGRRPGDDEGFLLVVAALRPGLDAEALSAAPELGLLDRVVRPDRLPARLVLDDLDDGLVFSSAER